MTHSRNECAEIVDDVDCAKRPAILAEKFDLLHSPQVVDIYLAFMDGFANGDRV